MSLFSKIFFGSSKLYDTMLAEYGLDYFQLKENTIANQASLYTCARIISDNTSTLPISVFRIVKGERVKDRDDHRHYLLNRRPNKLMNAQIWKSRMVYQLVKTGNAFSRIHRNENDKDKQFGQPQELEFITNVDTTKYHTSTKGIPYYILIDEAGKEIDKVPFRDMIHLRGFGEDLFGLSALDVLRVQTNTNDYAYQTLQQHHKGGARPEMFLQSGLTGRGSENVDKSIDEWEKKYDKKRSKGGFRRIPGNTNLVPWQVNLEQSQTLDIIKFNQATIAGLIGIPVFMLGDNDYSKFNNVEYLTRFFSSMTIRPNAHIWKAEFEDKLLTDKEWADGMRIEFNINSIIETDFATKGDYFQKMLMNGTVDNEWIAQKEGLPIPDNAKQSLVSNNHIPYDQLIEKMDLGNEKLKLEIESLKSQQKK